MIGQDGPLTVDEKSLLEANKNSELFRIARKVISHEYAKQCAHLPVVKMEYLQRQQGVLAGLQGAYNLLLAQTVNLEPDKKEPKNK